MTMEYPNDCGSGDSMKLDSGQEFGIGTTGPDEAIHVKGSGDTKIKVESTGSHSALYLVAGSKGWTVQGLNNNGLRFYEVGGGERVKFHTGGNVQINGGGYGDGHLVLGNYHIWVDTSGRLRIKNSSPTSSTDGTIVGTQS